MLGILQQHHVAFKQLISSVLLQVLYYSAFPEDKEMTFD